MELKFDKIIATLITINLFALLTLPQLNNVHYEPLPQFFAETTFLLGSLSLFFLACLANKTISIPKITIPLLIFAIYIASQPIILKTQFPGLAYVASIELIALIFLAISVNSLVQGYGLKQLVYLISLALVTGAIIQSIIGFLQYTGYYKIFGNIIFYDRSNPLNIFGHFGQRNHYCHYLTWGVFGLIYLFIKNKIDKFNFYSILTWLMFSITLGSSRSIFIYFALSLMISIIYYLKYKSDQAKQLLWLIIVSSIILFIFEYGYPLLLKAFHLKYLAFGWDRLIDNNHSLMGRRLEEWQKAWLVFKENPLFGCGFNCYAARSVYLSPQLEHITLDHGLFTNCHNLLLQLLAETGVLGTIIVVFGFSIAIFGLLKKISLEAVIILCMVATTLSHSMLEYPLWYVYFLGPLIIFLSLDKPLFTLNRQVPLGIGVSLLALSIYLAVITSIMYKTLVNYSSPPQDRFIFKQNVEQLETIINDNIFWAFPALYILDNYIIVNNVSTNFVLNEREQLKYENLLGEFRPYSDTLIKQALLNWNLGNHNLAKDYIKLALSAYPSDIPSFLKAINAKTYPELYAMINNYNLNSALINN